MTTRTGQLMLNRRLWILFVALVLVFIVIGTWLARLQLPEPERWRTLLQGFVHRQSPIDSYRGSIVDRNGQILAQDVPSDELAIDYRAMNLDDNWLGNRAEERLKASGEWARLPDREARTRRREEVKEELAQQIDAIPKAIGKALAPYQDQTAAEITEQVLERQNEIRKRIRAIRQDVWLQRYEKNARKDVAASSTGDSEIDDSALHAIYQRGKLLDEISSNTLVADIPLPVATYFKQHIDEFPGLSVRDQAAHNRRDYPFGEATAHIVGTMRSIEADVYKGRPFPKDLDVDHPGDLAGYLPGDRMGETGVERIAEDQLRGARGLELLDLSEGDRSVRDPRSIEPVPGKAVKVTIDAALQRDIYASLRDPAKNLLKGQDGKEHFAAAVVMALNGEILALITYPSYDPNKIDLQRVSLIRDDWRFPLVNRATSAIYHPGSTVKPLLAAAALTERVITPTETIHCSGHFYPTRADIFKCDGIHGDIDLLEAISKSCDVYFYTVGERMGLGRLVQWYDRFGFDRETYMELPEATGHLPNPAKIDPEQVKNDAMFMGIGQGPMDVTPLQLANAYATLLRRGVAVAPRILADTPVRQENMFDVSPETLATVRRGMEQVTTIGTAKSYFSDFRLRVAGKTGTAETDRVVFDDQGTPVLDLTKPRTHPDGTPLLDKEGKPLYKQLVARGDDAWFIGYAPAESPRYIVAAIMEWGGHGGDHAAPIVKEAFMQLQRHGYLPKTDVP